MIRILKIFFVLLPSFSLGQTNLIPNGSFEQLDSCPNGSPCIGLVELATGWYEPINCTSDLYNVCANGACTVPTFESVIPVDGNGMARILLRSSFGSQTREYIAIQLVNDLVEDSLYRFSLSLHLADNDLSHVGSIGAFFANDSSIDLSLNHQVLPYTAQLQRNPNFIMDDFNHWYYWEDTLIANGTEQFVLIGNFLDDANTPSSMPGINSASVYFVDNIQLIQINKPNSINELDVDFVVAPNPSSSVLTISYNGNLRPSFTRLLTIDGREVFSEGWSESVDVSQFAEGVYLLQVEFGNGAVGMERVVISR